MIQLKKFAKFAGVPGPVVVVVMDGIGLCDREEGNAVAQAYTPTLDLLSEKFLSCRLQAHGVAVGMPSDEDMGNSEVGHNAMGAGRIFDQGAKLVDASIASGAIFRGKAWTDLADNCRKHGSALHLLGLFSDGNVHSHMDHLKALIRQAKTEKIKKVRIHILLDGRDVGETSALEYVDPFEAFLKELNSPEFDARIASGGGRMKVTMDRYEADWSMVALGWKTHVQGEGRMFTSAHEAITALRAEKHGVIDQDLPAFVIAENGKAVGPVQENDSVVFFNFRGDRGIEISKAFEYDDFPAFDWGRRPRVLYAGMMQYDGDLKLPARFLVTPPAIDRTVSEILAANGVTQLAVSETQKFGHVTYFWNGNRSGYFDKKLETYMEVPSDRVPFEERPWMKAAEITDTVIAELKTGKYRFARLNYPNGDMVGHTGNFPSAVCAVQAVDISLNRLLHTVKALKGMAIITADHGNADEMYEIDKKTGKAKRDKDGVPKAKTSHTLNPVPCIFYYPESAPRLTLNAAAAKPNLANLAATVANLLGFEAPDFYLPSLLTFN